MEEEVGGKVGGDIWKGEVGDGKGERSAGAGGVPVEEVLVLQTC